MKRFILVGLWVGWVGMTVVRAETKTGAAFLSVGVGARAAGLGGAYTAVAEDPSALYWNPAGLSIQNRREVLASYSGWADARHHFLGYVQPTRWGALGMGGLFVGQNQLEGRSESRERTGSFGASDAAVFLSAARPLSPSLRTGLGVKLIRQTIAAEEAQGYAVDVGVSFAPVHRPWRLGLAARNWGPKMSFVREKYSLPTTLGGGVSAGLGSLGLASLDVDWSPVNKQTSVKGGVEWAPASALRLRGGYTAALTNVPAGEVLSGLVWGLGVGRGAYRLDYAYTPGNDLGSVQHLSVGVSF